MNNTYTKLTVVAVLALGTQAFAQEGEADLAIGICTESTPAQVVAEVHGHDDEDEPDEDEEHGEELLVLGMSEVSGLIQGYQSENFGFEFTDENEPEECVFAASQGIIGEMELVSIMPGFKVWEPAFSGVLTSPGDSWVMNPDADILFHDHPAAYHLDTTVQDTLDEIAAGRTHWPLTFVINDLGTTGYATSEEITVYYTIYSDIEECAEGHHYATADFNENEELDRQDICPMLSVVVNPDGASTADRCVADFYADGIITNRDLRAFMVELVEDGVIGQHVTVAQLLNRCGLTPPPVMSGPQVIAKPL